MAGCGCGGRKRRVAQTFELVRPDGTRTVHATRLEAEAANAREAKGRGKITVRRG